MVPFLPAVYCDFYNTHVQVGGEYQYVHEANCTWHYQPCLCPTWPQGFPGTNIEGTGAEEMGRGNSLESSGPQRAGGGGSCIRGTERGGTRPGERGFRLRALRSRRALHPHPQAATTALRTSTLTKMKEHVCRAVSSGLPDSPPGPPSSGTELPAHQHLHSPGLCPGC